MQGKSFRLLFYVLYTIAVPVVIFGVFEIGLRVAGYGYPTGFFKQTEINGKRVLINNRLFGLRFFPESLLREAEPFAFSKNKPDGCRRIFVLGSSAAQGDPDPTFGFSRILEVMLRRCYPTLRFEVINTAMTASNSHVALPIAKDCCTANPDFLVLYLGNNEVIGPFGAGTMLTPVFSNINVIRARIAVQSTRIGQLFTAVQRRGSRNEAVPESWGGMEMFLLNQIRSNSPALEKVYANYERNLLDMCRAATDAGAPAIVCTVPVNLKDSPPFASLYREGLSASELSAWDSLYKAGIALEQAGDLGGAAQKYAAAIGIDSLFAEAHFRLARCLEARGQFDRAKVAYERACNQDALLFRATKRINAIIREVSSRRELPLHVADVERRFEELSAHETPGRELFWDHVHLNFAGNYYAAQSVFFALEKILREKQSLEKTDSLPSLDQCAKEIVYSTWDEWHIASIMKERFEKPPFSNQAYHREQMDLLTHECSSLQKALTPAALDSIAEAHRNALERQPDDWRLRLKLCNLLEARRRYPEAIDNYQRILSQLPHIARAQSNMGAVFSLMGLRARAIAHYKTALTINPLDLTTLNSLGVELAKTGRTAEAAECFTKAFHFYPQYLSAHLNFANLLSEDKRFDEAKLHFDRALSLDSNHAVTYLNYGMSHIRQKNYREARLYIEKAVALDSASVNALMTLGNLLVKLGDLNGSARQFERVLTLDPANAGAKACLARLEKMGVTVKRGSDQTVE
jgi:tetratricopeptide (TPR) repeat protein